LLPNFTDNSNSTAMLLDLYSWFRRTPKVKLRMNLEFVSEQAN
jgi:hypothetical protein